MRLPILILASAFLSGCGGEGEAQKAGGEVTVELPPPLPPEPAAPGFADVAAGPALKAKDPAPPKALKETAAPDEAPAPVAAPAPTPANLAPARPPIPVEGLAGYIRGAGFQCDQVVATSRAAGGGVYKFDCANGGSYRGTMKRNHLYFRPWTGSPGQG